MDEPFVVKINRDLGLSDSNFLKRLEKCEREKAESHIIRSYIKEYHPVVAVISNSRQFLDNFLNTYGGVLDLEDIFITDAERDALLIKRCNGKYTVSFERPLALDPEKCTLCRRCVSLCEKEAIRPDPLIDTLLCDRCGACIDVCEFGAIDLYRRERIQIDADEIIIDEVFASSFDKSLPKGIFKASSLTELFKKVGSFEIEESVSYQFELCCYDTRLKVGCKNCIKSCENGALLLESDGVIINHELCSGCGACIASCPTGALECSFLSDRGFVEYFSSLNLAKGTSIVIGNENDLKELWWNLFDFSDGNLFFFVHDSPLSLSGFHFLFLATLGVGKIFIILERPQPKSFLDEVNFTNNLLKVLLKEDLIEISSVCEFLKRLNTISFQKNGLDINNTSFIFENRRQALSYLLNLIYSNLIKEEFFIPTDKFCQIALKDNCSLCLSCLNVCHQDALIAQEDELALFVKQDKCINCMACVDVCPENSITLTSGLKLCEEFFKKRLLIKDEPVKCVRCGKTFANKRSFSHTISILKERSTLDEHTLNILSLCETCRAKAFFEEILNGKRD